MNVLWTKHAVISVSKAIRRARVGLRNQIAIASFILLDQLGLEKQN
jgi:ATP-dependent Clp protease ATP-binding subunit ClpA